MTLGPIWHYTESSCVGGSTSPPKYSLPLGPVLHLPLGPSDMDDVQPVQVLHLGQRDKVPTSATGLTDKSGRWSEALPTLPAAHSVPSTAPWLPAASGGHLAGASPAPGSWRWSEGC